MKLVIRQYLESLKERGELDVMLPDLLSQMGMEVFLRPGIGTRQLGVDVAAVGSIDNSLPKVFLFSIKSGDLSRREWSSGNPQDLRPSIEEIVEQFIPQRIPPEHKSKPIEICLCFGGEVKEDVRPDVTAFEKKIESREKDLTFSEWNGDRLADLIEKYFLREELLPKESRGLLRKSLAMIDEPTVSFQHFSSLIRLLSNDGKNPKKTLIALRQIYLCTGILFTWSRDADNIESAYRSSEFVLLKSWDICKPFQGKKNNTSKAVWGVFDSIFQLYFSITSHFLEQKILPFCDKLHALSTAVNSSNSIDVNLKLFDILGRVSLGGIWVFWLANKTQPDNLAFSELLRQYQEAVKKLVINNPILFSPYKDDQAIDIVLALLLLSIENQNNHNIKAILNRLSESIYQQFSLNNHYPANIYSYSELIEHPIDDSEEYRKSVTKGSILYPILSLFSAIYEESNAYEIMKKLKEEYLAHCNYQIFFLDESSEEYLYNFDEMHGATLSHIDINQAPDKLITDISKECKLSNSIRDLSAVKYNFWPLILVASRHYRLPAFIHFVMELSDKTEPT